MIKLAVVGVAVVVGGHCDIPNELEFDPDSPAIAVAVPIVDPEVVAAAWAAANAAAFNGNIYLLEGTFLALFLSIRKKIC